MDNIQYKQSKTKLGMKNPDIWCSYFHISRDGDKSYSSGRTKIPQELKYEIESELKERYVKVEKLITYLEKSFLEAKITIDQDTNDILVIENKNTIVHFKNEGKDHLCLDVYSFLNKNKKEILIYYPKKRWKSDFKDKDYDWVFWSFSARTAIGAPYFHEITAEIFSKLLKK